MGASRREERGGFDFFFPPFYLSPKSGTDFIGGIDVEFVVLQWASEPAVHKTHFAVRS